MSRPIALEIMPEHVVDTLRSSMSDDEIATFFERFVAHARVTTTKITAAHEDRDARTMARHAHGLIGSAAMLGLTEIASLARTLEIEAETIVQADLDDTLSEAVAELEAALSEAE
ncbi:Hpt domain-containing protein [Pontivivens insulae]|uniref:HPt domain-containing protein n=1 Tax=Pontivivens insulae TaxID=1639689 RepID=A0A2R8A6S7_9RHOB|nr:Hpt domain-containing protein [Pontivivens insulae]SPF27934.1 hypothetical protein POI8812_00229 [Pontivivens insulae]